MLKSIFDLPKSKDQLEAANAGFASWKWLQKAPLRNIKDTNTARNFSRGQISYRWDMASSTYFMPSKCFLRLRCKLTKGDNATPLTVSDGIAPSMGLVPNLINECNLTINEQQISVADRHIGEIESMYTRINKAGTWMRDCGNSVNFWESDVNKRIQDVSSDGYTINSTVNEADPGDINIDSRGELGLGIQSQADGVAISLSAAHILTFTQNGTSIEPANVHSNFKVGDVLKIKFQGDVFNSMFYVIEVDPSLNNRSLLVASTGTTAGIKGAVNNGDVEIERYDYGQATYTKDLEMISTGNTSMSALNVFTSVGGPLVNVSIGDVLLLDAGGAAWQAYPVVDTLTSLTLYGGSFNVAPAIVAGANAVALLKYQGDDIRSGAAIGYTAAPAAANAHAIEVVPDAAGDAILTHYLNAAPTALPDALEIYKVGDIINMVTETGAVERHSFIVTELIDEVSVRVAGSIVLAGNIGSQNDGRDSIYSRVARLSPERLVDSAVNDARQLSEFEVNWAPRCLSFFRLPHSIPGGAKFQLNITAKNLYREAAIESLIGKTAGTDYNFQVVSMFLYIPTFEGRPTIDKTEFYLDLNEIRCQKVQITSQETSYTLDVRPSTNALACAVQSSDVDNGTVFSSSVFRSENDYQQKMSSFHVRFGSEQKPIPDFDMDFDSTEGRDHWNEIYMRNLLATNAYFDSSCETIQEYHKRGNYIYQIWNRSGDDRETRVYIKAAFTEAPDTEENSNPKLLLFNFYKKYGIAKLDNGRWQEIKINEV